ncbi:MAG: PH domain-containing protein [Ruminococcus sp.]|nr:PH domain-containing protein [Ruminococcus sp.]MBO5164940.1 PH domain-containing protein [Ruminococcus sp.]
MKKFKPDKNALLTMRVSVLVVSLLIMAAVRLYIPVNIIVAIIGIAVLTAVIFADCVYLPLYFAALSYETDGKSISKRSGVVYRSHKSVKLSTVQYTAAVTTPFSKRTGLNFLVLFVYGGQLRLLFLKHDDFNELIRLANGSGKELP